MADKDELATLWTGHELFDVDGNKIGTVEDVRFGDASLGLKWLVVETGILGHKKVFVPAGEVRRDGDRLTVLHAKDRVQDAPRMSDEPVLTPDEESRLCRYYGLQYVPPTAGADEGCQDMEDKRPGG